MAQDVPGAGRESRTPRQGFVRLGRRGLSCPRRVFGIYPMVYGCGQGGFSGACRTSIVAATRILEATAVRNVFGPRYERHQPRAGPGRHGTAAELGQFVTVGVSRYRG